MGVVDTYTLRQRQSIREMVGFEPTGPVQEKILNNDDRFMGVLGGEQGGKSFVSKEVLIERQPEREHDDPGLYWLAGERYIDSAREFDYIVEDFRKIPDTLRTWSKGNPRDYRQATLYDGTVIKTLSVGDTTTIGQEAPDGILFCEAGRSSLEAFHKLYARTAPRKGWMVMSGTVENMQPWYGEIMKSWGRGYDGHSSYELPTWSNRFLYPGGWDDPEIQRLKRELPEDFFWERLGAKVRPARGLVFGPNFKVGFHTVDELPFLPHLPVWIAVDPGYSMSAHSIVAMQFPPTGPIRVFDEIYLQGFDTESMIELAQMKPWWPNVQDGVIDIAATKMIQSVTPPQRVWIEKTRAREGGPLVLRSKQVNILDGIDRMKNFFQPHPITHEPRIVFASHLTGTLSEFGVCVSPFSGKMDAYRWNIKKDGTSGGQKPLDRANHSIKAITYLLVIRYGYVSTTGRRNVATVRHR